MKKTMILFAAMALVVSVSAQQKAQGPVAKNAKPWEIKSETVGYYVKAETTNAQGPVAKNAKSWEQRETTINVLVVSAPSEEKVTGPIAKNANPWDGKQSSEATLYAQK